MSVLIGPNGSAKVVLMACCFLLQSSIAKSSSSAFINIHGQHHRPYDRHWTKVSSSTAGEGGGVFYDGASDFGKQKQDAQLKRSNSNLVATSSQIVAKPNHQFKDIVIIGGGLAGLSAALFVSQMAPDRHVTIVERETTHDAQQQKKTTVASFAAAGMLAPQSERLPKGPLLDLCVASRRLYPDFCDLVETLAQDPESEQYLYPSKDDDKPSFSVNYVASGGFLAPAFAGDSVATWAPPDDAGTATWLDATQVRELEPNLHEDVVGGWWFPEDASVDARRLTCSLRAACVAAGVQLLSGAPYEVTSLDLVDGKCRGVWLKSGKYIHTKSVLVANGAWMRNLLPVPIEPHKGQSLSLRMPSDRPPLLRRVLFAQDSYIVPKADGRIVVGATVEAGSYDPNVTPAGIIHILSHALQLMPALADLPLEETWVGLRPTTPDKGPILGKTPWDNLFLAGGYWRNGVLLAPKTGQLLACLLAGLDLSPEDQALLDAFGWDRFTCEEGGAKMAANARYAASMHPIHKRTSGVGVAASVGTELGSYSDATTAKQERERDRNALWGIGGGDNDDALERAAQMGKQDAAAFFHGDDDDRKNDSDDSVERFLEDDEVQEDEEKEVASPKESESSQVHHDHLASLNQSCTHPFEGSPDAITVPSYSEETPKIGERNAKTASPGQEKKAPEQPSEQPSASSESKSNLAKIYEKIRSNKTPREGLVMSENIPEERPDPGFRIYHVDPETREARMVPPYTSPHEFQKMIAKEKEQRGDVQPETAEDKEYVPEPSPEETSGGDSVLDGYQAIQDAHSDTTEEEKAEAFRRARMSARQDFGSNASLDIDESTLPKMTVPPKATEEEPSGEEPPPPATKEKESNPDLSNIYEQIRTNKASQEVEMAESQPDDRPDPGFRIYRVDPDTKEGRMVPPYTSPQEFEEMIAMEKQQETEAPAEVMNSNDSLVEPTKTNGHHQPNEEEEEYNENTFDGYTTIQQANSRESREEELEAMRAARRKNRVDASEIDISEIGAQKANDM